MLKILQFYFGIVFVMAAFLLDRKLWIGGGLIWLFVLFVFYEVVSYNIFGIDPITYFHADLIDDEAFGRAHIGAGLVRAYGPAMNASVSGSILAIMFFVVISGIDGRRKVDGVGRVSLSIALLLAFLLCGSIAAYVTFGFLLTVLLIGHSGSSGDSETPKGRQGAAFLYLVSTLVIALLLYSYVLEEFLNALIASKFNADYLSFVWNLKLEQMSAVESLSDLLLGADLSGATVGEIGGDFVLLDAIVKIGLLGMLGLLMLLFKVCPKENRIFLLAGWVSSMHYGTIFTLCGQVFFGALCANSLSFANLAGKHRRLPGPGQK